MKRLYLFKLWQHSKTGFICAVIFVLIFGMVISKKMDMAFFPHNSMFSTAVTKGNVVHAYGVKVNNHLLPVTQNLYWKKDFLEMSLSEYAKFLQTGNTTLSVYMASKNLSGSEKKIVEERLLPSEEKMKTWLQWYLRLANADPGLNYKAEIYQYDFLFAEGNALVTDSLLLFSQNIITR